jgi:hypothetical protein
VQAVVTSVQELVLRLQQLEAADGRRPVACARGAADDEAERLRALHASGLLQHPPVRLFHDAAQKAAHAFGVKYAQVSLVDRDWVHTPGGLLRPTAHRPSRPVCRATRPSVPMWCTTTHRWW